MFYLGVDPSIKNTGAVLLDSQGQLVEAWDCGTSLRTKGFSRYSEQALLLCQNIVQYHVDISCGYEDYAYLSVHRAYDLAEYGGILKQHLVGHVKELFLASPNSVKRFGTGYGLSDKRAMCKAAATECGELQGKSDDICDAYFLALLAAYRHGVRKCEDKSLLRERISLAHTSYKSIK